MSTARISVIVPARNEEGRIGPCLDSILRQTWRDFELIVVDDASIDQTADIVRRFRDPRIILISNPVRLGIAASRNKGLERAGGEFIFFTDADCIVDVSWLKNGSDHFHPRTLGLSGRTFYVSQTFRPTIRDRIRTTQLLRPNPFIDSRHPFLQSPFMCCNVAYRKEAVERVGGFNEEYGNVMEDFELYLRIQEASSGDPQRELADCPDMIVRHQRELYTAGSLLRDSDLGNIIRLKRDHNYRNPLVFWGPVVFPTFLALAFCPPLWIPYFWFHGQGFPTAGDLPLIPVYFLRGILMRLSIWRAALRLGVFSI